DQVQTFYPSPMALATAMYHSGKNPLRKVTYKSEAVKTVREIDDRRVQKAFLRYHDEKNWPLLRETLTKMGRADLIGEGPDKLVPALEKRRPGQRHGKPGVGPGRRRGKRRGPARVH
ncbi:MAG: DUF3362 domain-containing protein, partial [Pseudomonadota bacterium]